MTPNPERTDADRIGNAPIFKFFAYDHLPGHLQAVSKPFADLARAMIDTLPAGAETSAGLRKLLEAKDCAVRARI